MQWRKVDDELQDVLIYYNRLYSCIISEPLTRGVIWCGFWSFWSQYVWPAVHIKPRTIQAAAYWYANTLHINRIVANGEVRTWHTTLFKNIMNAECPPNEGYTYNTVLKPDGRCDDIDTLHVGAAYVVHVPSTTKNHWKHVWSNATNDDPCPWVTIKACLSIKNSVGGSMEG